MMLRSSFLSIVAAGLLLLPCSWAGDQMNIEFLSHQALKKDAHLQELTEELQAELYGPPNHLMTGASLLLNGMFGVTFGLTNFKAMMTTGLVASGLWGAMDITDDVLATKSSKRARQKIRQIRAENAEIENRVNAYYTQLREGSTEARVKLSEMAGEEAVLEVQRNIEMEEAFRTAASQSAQARRPNPQGGL